MKRVILGFLIAPLASGLLQGVVMGNLGAVIFAWVFAYPFSIILGAPVFLVFKKNGWLKLWHVVVAGATLGVIGGLVFSLVASFENYSIQSIIKGLGLFGLHGLVVSLVFWFVAIMKVSSNKSLKAGTPQSGAP